LLVPFEAGSAPDAGVSIEATATGTVIELVGIGGGTVIELDLSAPIPLVRHRAATGVA
jgi:hypothetical protein